MSSCLHLPAKCTEEEGKGYRKEQKPMTVIYYDIGVNLFGKQFPEPKKIIREAREAGVECILTGTDMKENKRIDAFTRTYQAYGTAGIHPHNADSARQEDFDAMEKIVRSNGRIVAVGECGLDFDRMFSSKENQIRCLEKHIILAEKLGKPLFLHERNAADEFVKRFKRHPDICQKSVVHCFTGSRDVLEKYLSMGFSIGITGWICDDRRAGELRRAVKAIPLDRVLMETDAPYLTPKNVPGLARTNVPQNIRYVADDLARYMGVERQELIENARKNTERIFGIRPEQETDIIFQKEEEF